MTNLTDRDIFQMGCEAFRQGWPKIPPYWITALRPQTRERIGSAKVWMNGWEFERDFERDTDRRLEELMVGTNDD